MTLDAERIAPYRIGTYFYDYNYDTYTDGTEFILQSFFFSATPSLGIPLKRITLEPGCTIGCIYHSNSPIVRGQLGGVFGTDANEDWRIVRTPSYSNLPLVLGFKLGASF